jgi:hypothetical protein
MNDSNDISAFGITIEQRNLFNNWILDRIGSVYASNGKGGSGVFLEYQNGGGNANRPTCFMLCLAAK